MRSIEFSLERLGLDRVDIVYAHDVDVFTHGSGKPRTLAFANSWKAATRRWRSCATAARFKRSGPAINEWEVAETLARAGDFDVFLLAGRYTLLEQEALQSFLPYCVDKKIGVVIGGPFNSGDSRHRTESRRPLRLPAGAAGRARARAPN